jgi:hypothetical protein
MEDLGTGYLSQHFLNQKFLIKGDRMEIFYNILLVLVVIMFFFWLFKPEKKSVYLGQPKKSVYPDRPAYYPTSRNPVTSIKTPSTNRNSDSQSSYSSSGASDFCGVYDVGGHYDSGCFGGGDSGGGGDCGGVGGD